MNACHDDIERLRQIAAVEKERDLLRAQLVESERKTERTRDRLRRCANAFEVADAEAANRFFGEPSGLEGEAVDLQAERDDLGKRLVELQRLYDNDMEHFARTNKLCMRYRDERDELRAQQEAKTAVLGLTTLTSDQYVTLLYVIQERYGLADDEVMSALAGILLSMCRKHGISITEFVDPTEWEKT